MTGLVEGYKELNCYPSHLDKAGWIDTKDYLEFVVISVAGHAHLESLRATHVESGQAFVAMWFDPNMEQAWTQGIEPAIRQVGYKSLRIDRKEHNNRIDYEIIAEVRRSRFLVADFSQAEDGARGGVYYEAGFAHGLNIPVIFTCRKKDLGKVHFDTRQFNHIVWEQPGDLKEKLTQRISATIGDGPLRG